MEAISPGIYSDQLDRSGPDLRWQKLPSLQISCSKPHKEFEALRHTRLTQAQLVTKKNIDKQINMPVILGGCIN